jgi:hypothetical protein
MHQNRLCGHVALEVAEDLELTTVAQFTHAADDGVLRDDKHAILSH